MRRRLLLSTLAAVAVALLLLGLPLGFALAQVLQQRALDELQRQAEQVQVLVQEQAVSLSDVATILDAFARQSGTRLTLLDRSPGGVIRIDTGGQVDDEVFAGTDADLAQAAAGQVGRVAVDGMLAVTVPVRGDGAGQQLVRASRSDAGLAAEVRRAWLAIAGLGAVALGAAVLVARRQGERLATPVERLVASAAALGDGDFSARGQPTGVPEVDQVALALDVTATRLGALVARSQSFGADASHQLRTPLTALRLQLDALAAAREPDEVARAVDAAQAEADRLESTIAELITLTTPGAETVPPLDLARVAHERAEACRALAQAQGREVVVHAEPSPPVPMRVAAIGQALQVLLDNALAHGRGTITVVVQPVPGGVRLGVADEGRGLPPQPPPPAIAGPGNPRRDGRGRGLPLAAALVEAEGGRLVVEQPSHGAFVSLLLPNRRVAPAS